MIWDTFMICQELDMLECRLREYQDIPDLIHVAVEADVDHQNHPKPYILSDNLDRFAAWSDRLRVVRATDLPTVPNSWAREHAQREWVAQALEDAQADDLILHGDIDEIPTKVFVRNVKPRGFVVAGQRFHPFAVDWLHPQLWPGTVAGRIGGVTSFAKMRDARLTKEPIPLSGWHFSWVGGHEMTLDKIDRCCHPEIKEWVQDAVDNNDLYTHGYHVDGRRLERVTDLTGYPSYITEGLCPDSWFAPPEGSYERQTLTFDAGTIYKTVPT